MSDYTADEAILQSIQFTADDAYLNATIEYLPPTPLPDWFYSSDSEFIT